jgi:site-specific recombinase XerD
MSQAVSIQISFEKYLKAIENARSNNTYKTYRQGINSYSKALKLNGIDINSPVDELSPSSILAFVNFSRENGVCSQTERLYLTVISNYFQFLLIEELSPINIERVKGLIKQYGRKTGKRLIQFPQKAIERVIEYAEQHKPETNSINSQNLIDWRNRALLLTLADTGLRINEAVSLKLSDVNFENGTAIIIGKGDKQAVIYFSARSLKSILEYLAIRSHLDSRSVTSIKNTRVFTRHNRNSWNKLLPISTQTGEDIVRQMVNLALGDESTMVDITPHSFRHRFVTEIVAKTGNLKLAQELARHSSVSITERYTHLADIEVKKSFRSVFG